MITLMKKLALSLFLMMSVAVFAQQKPKIRILATGGTIAGVSKSNTEPTTRLVNLVFINSWKPCPK